MIRAVDMLQSNELRDEATRVGSTGDWACGCGKASGSTRFLARWGTRRDGGRPDSPEALRRRHPGQTVSAANDGLADA